MKKNVIALISAVFFAVITVTSAGAAAPEIYKNTGYAGPAFLLMPFGARPAGLAGAFSALSDDSNALMFNPAGLGRVKQTDLQLMYSQWVAGITYQYAAYAQRFGFGAVGINYAYWTSPEMTEIVNETAGAKFTLRDSLLTLGAGFKLAKWCKVGFNVRNVQSAIGKYSVNTTLTDAGLILNTIRDGMSIGLAVQNMGSPVKYISEQITIPQIIRGAVNFRLVFAESYSVFNIGIEAVKPVDGDIDYYAGIEHIGGDALALRVGYKYSKYDMQLDQLSAWRAGVGLNLGGVYIDYAYIPFARVGQSHLISLGYKFKPPPEERKYNTKLGVTFDNIFISPNGDGMLDDVVMKPFVYEIDEVKGWNLEIKSSTGAVVKKFSGESNVPLDIPWSIKDEAGNVLPQGKYSAVITVLNKKKRPVVSPPTDIYVDITPPVVEIILSTPVFTPDGDGVNEIVDIKLKLWDLNTVIQSTFSIVDTINTQLMTYTSTGSLNGKAFQWDGKSADKKALPNAAYAVTVTAMDMAGNVIVKQENVTIAVPPLGMELIMSTNTITPDGDGVNDFVNFELRVNNSRRVSEWSLSIFNSVNKPVKVYKSTDTLPAVYKWDGTDDIYGKTVPQERYAVKFVAIDTAGNENVVQDLLTIGKPAPAKVEIKDANVRQDKRGLVVDLSSEILFGKGRADLSPYAYPAMDGVAALLKQYSINKVSIEGHTDTVGGDAE
ncbi:MAG: PorV/PorQ family protein, partial [Elusimicrobiota bacterium]